MSSIKFGSDANNTGLALIDMLKFFALTRSSREKSFIIAALIALFTYSLNQTTTTSQHTHRLGMKTPNAPTPQAQ